MVTLSQQDLQSVVSSLVLFAIVLSLLSAFMALMMRDMLYSVVQLARPLIVYLVKLQRLRRAHGLSYSQAHRLVGLMKSSFSLEHALRVVRAS